MNLKKFIDGNALFVVSHSGGKDSQAMMIHLRHLGIPANQMLVVHASLGEIEWEGAMEIAELNAKSACVPFIVARARRTLFDMVQDRYQSRPDVPSWPSSATRQCTSDLKRGPITREARRYANLHGHRIVVNCMGFRAQESPARAKRLTFSRVDRNCTMEREWFDWLPIHDWDVQEVFQSIADDNQEPHPAYNARLENGVWVTDGNDRLSCVFCIFGSENDIKNGARSRPELAEKYIAMEDSTGYTMHMSRKPLRDIISRDIIPTAQIDIFQPAL